MASGGSFRLGTSYSGRRVLLAPLPRSMDHCFVHAPASAQAHRQPTPRHTDVSSQLVQRPVSALIGKAMIVALVGSLLKPGSPAAIYLGVVAAVVYPFDGVLPGRTRPHVDFEVVERHPSVAYGDATAAVFHIRLVGAAEFHGVPDEIEQVGFAVHSARVTFQAPQRLSGAAPLAGSGVSCGVRFQQRPRRAT